MFVLDSLPRSIQITEIFALFDGEEPVLYSLSKHNLEVYLVEHENTVIYTVFAWYLDGVLHIESEEVYVRAAYRNCGANYLQPLPKEKLV